MAKYKVRWDISVFDAESPLDAAMQANEMRRNDPENEFSFFRVLGPDGKYYRVDTANKFVQTITKEDAERIG